MTPSPAYRTVAIIGGHGKIARSLTRSLASQGRAVLSVVRNPGHLDDVQALGAQGVLCDVEQADADEIARALEGADAIVFAAGAGPGSGAQRKGTMDRGGSVKCAAAAQRAGVSRFVQVSFIGADQPTPKDTEEVFAAYWDAKRDADEALMSSSLDWTIIRPGGLSDEPGNRQGTLGEHLEGGTTRREDVATLISLVLDERRSIGRVIDVIEGPTDLDQALLAFVDGAPQPKTV